MKIETSDMTGEEKRAYARQTVFEFTLQFWQDIGYHVGQIVPGAEVPHLSYDIDEFFKTTMEPQEWLTMALYGLGLAPNEDPGEMYEICQSLAEWMFSIPGMSTYHIPDVWYDSPMGVLWAAAFIRVQGDELISLAEASEISGASIKSLAGRVDRGTLKSYTNPDAHARQGKRLVRKSDILPKS